MYTINNTIGSIYFRPEATLSISIQTMEHRFINFGIYTEPNFILKRTLPQYELNYNKSSLSSYNTLTSTTYYHWGKDLESGSGVIVPINLLGFSAGYTQTSSNSTVKMIKCRLFFELDPQIIILSQVRITEAMLISNITKTTALTVT